MKHFETIVKKTGIIKASPTDQLSAVISKLKSSHDAAFIFDDKEKFVGVINPYYTLIKSSAYDGNTKVANALFHPPHIGQTDSIARIVKLMNESKIHYLPVFDEEERFVGITSARRILAYMKDFEVSKLTLSQISHTQKGLVITVKMTDPISAAISLFKDYKTSKIVVVDEHGKLRGILSHYDLIPYLLAPGRRTQKGRKGERPRFVDTPVKNYAKTTVLKMKLTDTVHDALEEILAKEIGSLIIVDEESRPVGIVTSRHLLDLLRDDIIKKPLEISADTLLRKHKVTFKAFAEYVKKFMQETSDVTGGLIVYQSERKDTLFKIQVHLQVQKGSPLVITREGKDFSRLLQEIKDVMREVRSKT